MLPVSQQGARPVPDGVFSLASGSPDANRVTVMLASWLATGGNDRTVAISFRGLRRGTWIASTYRIDGHPRQAPTPLRRVRVRSPLVIALPARSVVLVVLTRVGRLATGR